MGVLRATAARSCHVPGCPELNCQRHSQQARRREMDQHRGSARARGYDSRWERARKAFLQANPLCVAAQRRGRVEAASVVDHIKPHQGDHGLFWDASNWQPLSARAHARKTARESGLVPCDDHGQGAAFVRGEAICRDCGGAA